MPGGDRLAVNHYISIMAKMNKEEAVQWYAQNRGLYKKLSLKIQNIIVELLEEANIPIHAVTNRAKDVDSFKTKIDDPKYDDPLKQITDLSGIRIIAYVEDDLIPICKIIEETLDIDQHNSGDKSVELGIDKVGYKSIHYIAKIKIDRLKLPEYKKFKDLKFEIQVRTILQHAWAEIEHDRNYKFNGVLPQEITRRFKILAGTLELIDREFNQLSRDIDKISQSVAIAEKKNELSEISVNTTTLKQFFVSKFKSIKELINFDFNGYDDDIIEELHNFGIRNLEDLEKIIPKNFAIKIKEIYPKNEGNMLGLLREIMMIADNKRYFENSWTKSWTGFGKYSAKLLNSYNIDVQSLGKQYDILVQE